MHKIECKGKTLDSLKQEIAAIPSKATSIDFSLNDLYCKAYQCEDLVVVFSQISNHVTHIDLGYNVLCARKPQELARIFSSFPSHISSLALNDNGINTWTVEDINILSNSLVHLKTIYLSSIEVAKLKHTQPLLKIGVIFPNVTDVILLDSYGNETINDKNEHATRRANNARSLGVKAEVPSLKNQAAFFLEKTTGHSQKQIIKQNTPEELHDLGKTLGALRYGS